MEEREGLERRTQNKKKSLTSRYIMNKSELEITDGHTGNITDVSKRQHFIHKQLIGKQDTVLGGSSQFLLKSSVH